MNAFVEELVVALTNTRIYGEAHPRVGEIADVLLRHLQEEFTSLQRDTIEIGAADGYLFFDQRPLLGARRVTPRLLEVLERLGSGGLAFDRGTTRDELLSLVKTLAVGKKKFQTLEEVNRHLEEEGIHHVRCLPGYVIREGAVGDDEAVRTLRGLDGPLLHVLQVPLRIYGDLVAHLTDVMTDAIQGRALQLDGTRDQVHRILGQAEAMQRVTESRRYAADQFQFRHSIRMAALAVHFAGQLTSDDALLLRIGTAALLHDIGKARVDWNVFHAQGRLTEEGYREMSKHPFHGAQILLEQGDADPMAVTIALGHHRTMGGRGYPAFLHRLPEEEVSLGMRIVKICDVYEALTGDRDYRDAASPVKAFRIMLSMGEHFDRALLHRFIRTLGFYPDGTWVELAGGEIGWVEKQTQDPTHPVVLVVGNRVEDGGHSVYLWSRPNRRDPRRDRSAPPVQRWLGHEPPAEDAPNRHDVGVIASGGPA